MNKFFIILLTFFIAACGQTLVAQAKPSAAIDIQHTAPKNISSGDNAVATITLVAKTDIQHLTVDLSAYKGLTLVSGDEHIQVSGLNNGESHQLDVTIHLIDNIGYLAVKATLTDINGQQQHKNIALRFGERTSSSEKTNLSEIKDKKFILMPAKKKE